jgi:hypothetical protein
MGEWSDYFEDFPEENPANYLGSRFDPDGARKVRALEGHTLPVHAEVQKMLTDAWEAEKGRSLFAIDNCPQCGLKELNTYKLKGKYFLGECQDCGIYGRGKSQKEALNAIEEAFGEGLDWRDEPAPWGL